MEANLEKLYQDRDAQLWGDWKKHYSKAGIDPKSICKDGIINSEMFLQAKHRVLFILKDSNDFAMGDLRKLWNERPQGIGRTIGRWAAGILNDFPELKEIDNSRKIHESLKSVAVINLKKATGGRWAWDRALHYFTLHDKDLLLRQIQLIAPYYVIACGTMDQLRWLLDIKPDKFDQYFYPNNEQPDSELPLFSRKYNAWLIPFRHPGRAGKVDCHNELKYIWQKIHTT